MMVRYCLGMNLSLTHFYIVLTRSMASAFVTGSLGSPPSSLIAAGSARLSRRPRLAWNKVTYRPLRQAAKVLNNASGAAQIGDDARHVIVPAFQSSTDDERRSSTLLLLLPGAYMAPADFQGIIRPLQASLERRVWLWVAIAHPIWQEVDVKAPDVMQQASARVDGCAEVLLHKAEQQGFLADRLPSGRCNNMFVLAHSSAALFAVPLAARIAGALILLGSYFFPSDAYHASLSEWSRPVMHLGGRLDGQARFSRMAFAALQAATFAARTGSRYAAINKPVVLLPGVNHAQLSTGVMKDGAVDLKPEELGCGPAAEIVAESLGQFLLAHRSQDRPSQEGAITALQEACASTFAWLSPFTEALGRGAIDLDTAAYKHRMTLASSAQSLHKWPEPCSAAHGAEILPDNDLSRRFIAHPGEISMAECFCTDVQSLLADVDRDSACLQPGGLKIVSTVHTDIDMFIYSQPSVELMEGQLLIHAHCYLHRPSLVPFGHRIPLAPQYLLKLKSAEAIALWRSESPGAQNLASPVTGESLNRATHEQALRMLAQPEVDLYERRGKRLSFLPDRDVSKEVGTAVDWVKGMPLEMVDVGPGRAEVCSPVIRAAAQPPGASSSPAAAKFSGNLYLKCMSLAGAIEWIMCDSLRAVTQP